MYHVGAHSDCGVLSGSKPIFLVIIFNEFVVCFDVFLNFCSLIEFSSIACLTTKLRLLYEISWLSVFGLFRPRERVWYYDICNAITCMIFLAEVDFGQNIGCYGGLGCFDNGAS